MQSANTAAPLPRPMPRRSDATLRFSPSAASSSSSRTIALVRSATCFTAVPTPWGSASWMGMAPPVDPLGEDDAGDDGSADDQKRIRTTVLLGLLPLPELRTCRRQRRLARLLVRGCLPSCARLDQARLELTDEVGILRERLGELRLDAALAGELVRHLLQLVCGALDILIGVGHLFVGGSSPVSVRQIREAVRRDTIVATAAIEP